MPIMVETENNRLLEIRFFTSDYFSSHEYEFSYSTIATSFMQRCFFSGKDKMIEIFECFKIFDHTNTGTISRPEMALVSNCLGRSWTRDFIRKLFQDGDKNGELGNLVIWSILG